MKERGGASSIESFLERLIENWISFFEEVIVGPSGVRFRTVFVAENKLAME